MVAALLQRDYLIRASYRFAIVMDFALGVVDVLVYYFISKTFEGASAAALGGAPSYFAYAFVGIAVTTVINSTAAGIGIRVREEQLTGTLEALVVQPVSSIEAAIGMCGLPFLFAAARVVVYLVPGALLLGLDLSQTDWMGFALMMASTGGVMSAIGIASSAVVIVWKRGNTIGGLVIFGMSMVGGGFFPISVLPGWLEPIGKIVPARFAFDGLRDALYTGSGWETDALILAAISVVALPLSVWTFGRGLHHARRTGSLSEY